MPPNNEINPNHSEVRGLLRVIAPIMMIIGVGCILVALIDLFSAGIGRQPTLFWLFFIGMPLLAVGGMISQFAFLGAVARYTAQETAPVVADTINYMGRASAPGITAAARAVSQGIATPAQTRACPACGTQNDPDARFCDTCGDILHTNQRCPKCQSENDPQARYCDHCGNPLTQN